MSISFMLMRGEYDAILTFPFNYKVSFCLFDQTSQQRHLIESFRLDMQSNSFQRPQSETNIPSGIHKLCPLSILQQPGNSYVRDDSIFIKVIVNTGDIPTVLLSYAFSLESGLSIDVRKAMIQKEQETRQQLQATITARNSQDDLELSQRTLNTMQPPVEIFRTRQTSTVGSRGVSPEDGRGDVIQTL
jgi:hypothetical protein